MKWSCACPASLPGAVEASAPTARWVGKGGGLLETLLANVFWGVPLRGHGKAVIDKGVPSSVQMWEALVSGLAADFHPIEP